MPTLNETVTSGQASAADQATTPGVVEATVVEPGATGQADAVVQTEPAASETAQPVAKKAAKKAKPVTEGKETSGEEAPAGKKAKKVKTAEELAEDKLIRPPMEQIHRDVERLILESEVAGFPVKKLEYKCGKLIYGIANADGKDFRVIALKARKKTKSVAGKSRCIYYFGISDDHSNVIKTVAGTHATNFGRCSVQCKRPIELVIDKTSYKEAFGQSANNIVSSVTKLIKITCEQKTAEYESLKTKSKEKAEAKEAKAAKKEKAAVAKKAAIEKATAKKE